MHKSKSAKKNDTYGSKPRQEPEDFQYLDDNWVDWTPDAEYNEPTAREPPKRETTASLTQKLNKKKKQKYSSSEEGEIEEEDENEPTACETPKRGKTASTTKSKRKPKKQQKYSSSEEEEVDSEEEGSDEDKSIYTVSLENVPKHFHSGNFVLFKSDVKWKGDSVVSKLDDLILWKIEGKALLRKFIPTKSDGKILHKGTVVYTGWNVNKMDDYYPITKILDQNLTTDCKDTVSLDLNDLIKVR